MKKRIRSLAAVSAILLAVALFFFAAGRLQESITVSAIQRERPVIVIDPGHGGMDGGAIGDSGVVEKGINLAIALQLKELLSLSGFDVIMTRESDISLHDENISGIREQKRSDIKNRLKIMEEHEGALVVMIHQNQFSESKYSGAQMFYGPGHPDSKRLAEQMQAAFRQLQPDNKREIKPGTRDVYLLYNCKNPVVLAECGFISNPEECRKLQQPDYQQQVAFAILMGLLSGETAGSPASQQT
ncbi:MAG: N-acetylmuramoyl-L-alanine amidase [Oscillospiraceae bacterium]|nr:N-acetylmuramoyl-L-alanine amidase [Oscillospiraceae bacterium]